jgi:adenosylcobinamide kinase/adenosylcobinamide-phosphate guanylyltransferase
MKIFISGGCKNGKSSLAQHLAKKLGETRPLYYVATMIPHDGEDRERIRRHIVDREGWGFTTIEQGLNILEALETSDCTGAYLMDSVTALLANEMFRPDGSFDEAAPERVAQELCAFAERVGAVILVSDYIYGDCGLYDAYTEAYLRGLAHVDRALAQSCDAVYECCAGNVTVHKGAFIL